MEGETVPVVLLSVWLCSGHCAYWSGPSWDLPTVPTLPGAGGLQVASADLGGALWSCCLSSSAHTFVHAGQAPGTVFQLCPHCWDLQVASADLMSSLFTAA